MRIFAALAALAYVSWGLLHVYQGVIRLNDLANLGLLAAENGWLAQSHFAVVWAGAVAVVFGAFFTWRNSVIAYWLLAIVISAHEIGFYLFRMLPELVTPPFSLISPSIWLAGLILSTIAMLTRSTDD